MIRLLDVYAPGGVAEPDPRIDALATVSAGSKKDGAKFPSINRDGRISLHDPERRAPGLARALQATGGRSLTIAFPFSAWEQVVQQRFQLYSAARLLISGDEHGLTVFEEGGARRQVEAGTEEYAALLPQCSVSTSVYFMLASWESGSPQIVMPDGLGFYRLRFTSRQSARNLLSTWGLLQRFTGGPVAGVPLELQLVNRDVAGPDGSRRTVPVWTFLLRPPQALALGSGNLKLVLGQALQSAASLQLPAPEPEVIEAGFELAAPEQDAAEPIEEALPEADGAVAQQLESGVHAASYTRRFFAILKGTPFAEEAREQVVRAACVAHYGEGDDRVTGSLREALARGDRQLAELLIVEAERVAGKWEAFAAELKTDYNAVKRALGAERADALVHEHQSWRTDLRAATRLRGALNVALEHAQ